MRIAKSHHRRLLTRDGTELDSVTAFMRHIRGDGYSSMLETVVDRFRPITELMQTEGTIRDVGVSYVRSQKVEGVAYSEGRFAPQYHTREGLSLKEVIRSMAEGLAEGAETYGVGTSLIVAIGRESSPSLGEEVARAAAADRSVVALDLGGPERGNPPGKFREAFRIAADSGLKATVHAGEGAGSRQKNLANIEAAVTRLGARRLGHAIDLVKDERLMALMRENAIAVESSPISNLTLRKIGDLRDLGVDRLLEEGISVSLNSDDPALWPEGGLSHVYSKVCRAYGFGLGTLDRLAENAIKGAFASDETKGTLLENYGRARRRMA